MSDQPSQSTLDSLEIKQLKVQIEQLGKKVEAINAFLVEKFTETLGGGPLAVYCWHQNLLLRNQRDEERMWQIERLKQEGYFVTKNYEPKEQTQK